MIEEEAVVSDVKDDYVWLKTGQREGCGSCSSKDSCSTTVLSPLFKKIDKNLKVHTELSLKPGDVVILGVDEKTLLRAAISLYAIPILVLIIFSIFGQQFALNYYPENVELFSIISGLLAVSFLFLKRWLFTGKIDQISGVQVLRVKQSIIKFGLLP